MIKDSKLIGTKIKSPYGWKKFKVGELFDYKSSKSLNKGDLTFVSSNSEFSIPYITRTVFNNGINGYVDSRSLSPEYINSGSEFAFGLMGLTAFYQSGKYCTGQFVKRFVPKFKINSLLALYFKTMLDRQIEMFKTVSIRSYDVLINDVIQLDLPVLSNSQPDFAWMDQYMTLVQEDYLQQKKLRNQSEIKAYLTAGKVDSTAITADDRKFLRDFEKLPRRKFKVMDFLILKNSPDVHFEQKKLPLISAGDNNHGIRSWVQTFEYCNNVITISKLGQTFYYHQSVCYTDDVLGLQLPVDSILFGIYLQTLLNKQTRQISSYGHQFRMKRLDELSLLLPTSGNDEVDVESIEKYMQIQSKPLINNVAETLASVAGGN